MLDPKKLFYERLAAHSKELSRYLRYIFTGHLVIAMVFIVSALSVYYQQWLEAIPSDFPSVWIIAIALGAVTTYNPIQTLLKRADVVFLIPAETQLISYFVRTLVYSYVTQIYLFFIVMAAIAPFFFTVFPNRQPFSYGFLLVILLIIKAWSLIANWWMLRERDPKTRLTDQIVRFALITAIILFYLKQDMLFTVMVTILLAALFSYNYRIARKQKALNWDLLIERDYLRMRSFYRLANMFTEVPHIETQVKKRHLLAQWLTAWIPFKQSSSYTYLYRLTTVRSGEYLGVYLRLFIIGALLIYYVPNPWVKWIFAMLFLYMTLLQIAPMWKHHVTIVWLDLYPISEKVRKESFQKWMKQLMFWQVVGFTVLFMVIGNIFMTILMAIAGLMFVYGLIPTYLQKQWKG
ncbi:ABC transporter permease [Gracilibacillus sp. YIM 98692]|uniref:ABC transporter permease n=1 Tax=Gracilibacillus sp. YIM 98692 TaxID=2663532 RepID=UPI0013D3FF53|nr:ABC transporter permease [Gracilibacillus sp. YIM 98692]